MGFASVGLEQYQQAEQAYRKAAEVNASSPSAWQGLEKLYQLTGQTEQHEEVLRQLLKLTEDTYVWDPGVSNFSRSF